MRKSKAFEKERKIKSLGFFLIAIFLPVFIVLVLMSNIRGKTMPPDWVVISITVITGAIFTIAIFLRSRDIIMPNRHKNITKYFKIPLIVYLVYFIIIATFDILVNIRITSPIDYSRISFVFLEAIVCIIVISIIWLICLQLLFKAYYKIIKKKIMMHKKNQLKKIIHIVVVLVYITLLFGLRITFSEIHGFYNINYTCYGDIASFVCVFGGGLGAVLILCIQNRSRFIPLKFLDGLVEKVLAFDEKERKQKLQRMKKK